MTEAIKDLPALAPAERAAVVLQSEKAAAELTALVESSQSITAITSADGRTECHAAAMKARAARVAIEKSGKDARDDATAFSKAVIAEEKRLVAIIEPEQDRLLILRDGWDAKIEAEKAAKIEAERLRVATIRDRIDGMRDAAVRAVGKDARTIGMMVSMMTDTPIDESFAEFADEAEGVKRATLAKLADMHAAAMAAEAEAARIAEEKRLADERSEKERIEREAEAKRQREENERIRAENAAEQARLMAEAERIRAESKAAADKLKAEREDFEKQQAEAAEQQRQKYAAEAKAKADAEAAEKSQQQTDQATVSKNGASSPPEFPAVLSPAEAIAPEPAPSAVLPATGAASVAYRDELAAELHSEIEDALYKMTYDELQQVAHFIDRLQSLRKAA